MSTAASPPYVAVIFTSQRTGDDAAGYERAAARMVELASVQPGFVGIESARGADGFGITVSYWIDQESARRWKHQIDHAMVRDEGRAHWYSSYELRVAEVVRAYGWERHGEAADAGAHRTLLHLALPDDWHDAIAGGRYAMSTRGVTLEQEGFIHCSFPHQVQGVARRFYADLDELVLLTIDPEALPAAVVVEPPADGIDELFPHVYGPIPIEAIVTADVRRRAPDEEWSLP